MLTKEKKLEILEDTVAFYGADPVGRRSGDDVHCLYNGPGGSHCAVARLAKDPSVLVEGEGIETCGLLEYSFGGRLCDSDLDFLLQLQYLHDTEAYWDDNVGLTHIGERRVAGIRELIEDGEI